MASLLGLGEEIDLLGDELAAIAFSAVLIGLAVVAARHGNDVDLVAGGELRELVAKATVLACRDVVTGPANVIATF